MPECPPRPPAPAAPSRSLTRLLVARFSFSRSHRTLRGIAGDGRLCLRLGGCSFTGATAPPRRRRGSKTKGQREGREQPKRKQAAESHSRRRGRKPRGERGRDRSFQPSSESASGASDGPRSVPHQHARTAPGPSESAPSGTTSTQVYGRSRKKLRSTRCQGRMD